jgi:hypothetical protein
MRTADAGREAYLEATVRKWLGARPDSSVELPRFAASGLVAAVELPGSRALVAHQGEGQPLHLLGWRQSRGGGSTAFALLAALRRVAQGRSASTVRVQPWIGTKSEDELVRACRMLAFAPRPPLTIQVRSASAAFPGPAPSPFFYATS